jgi:hypothetical protein
MRQGNPAMTIEIRQPELEALIQEQMESGAFRTVTGVIRPETGSFLRVSDDPLGAAVA